jgi:hypothetical protein
MTPDKLQRRLVQHGPENDQVAGVEYVDLVGEATRSADEGRSRVQPSLRPSQPQPSVYPIAPSRAPIESEAAVSVQLPAANKYRPRVARDSPECLGPIPTDIRRLGGLPDKRQHRPGRLDSEPGIRRAGPKGGRLAGSRALLPEGTTGLRLGA